MIHGFGLIAVYNVLQPVFLLLSVVLPHVLLLLLLSKETLYVLLCFDAPNILSPVEVSGVRLCGCICSRLPCSMIA